MAGLTVLIHAPTGRDATATAEVLARVGIQSKVCADLATLLANADAGAAAIFIAEEALFGQDLTALSAWVRRQPAWSDLPFVVLTSRQNQPAVIAWRKRLVEILRNVSLLERPVQTITLSSALQAARRARQRQYEVRDLLEEQARAAQALEGLVAERTQALETANVDLAAANRELHNQMEVSARAEESLRQIQKIEAIGQLTGGVAHDFNNLLMVISGGLDMLERQADADRRKRILEGMHQAAQRGASLTRQLLAFSRRKPLEPEPVDLMRQIGGMSELLDRTLRGDVHVELSFADDLWPIDVDPGELELVVLNLAVNARDAMPNGGTIMITARNAPGESIGGRIGNFVRLSVIDTGTGMPPEVQDRVFEPFFTTKDIGKGSGLGLAQVYGFATQSGGTVRIDSKVDQGTEVILFLPRSADQPSPVVSHLIDLRGERPNPKTMGRVLLVEDDDEVATLVNEMLDQLGYDVFRVASAAAALGALANDRAFDLVFSDVMMPGGMSGVDLAKEVQARRPHLPILLTSGYAEAAVEAAQEMGVYVLPKPYRLDQLAAGLGRLRPAEAQGA
jgi:signal transduction histidine kinase/CheY-like chemotaxis protein